MACTDTQVCGGVRWSELGGGGGGRVKRVRFMSMACIGMQVCGGVRCGGGEVHLHCLHRQAGGGRQDEGGGGACSAYLGSSMQVHEAHTP